VRARSDLCAVLLCGLPRRLTRLQHPDTYWPFWLKSSKPVRSPVASFFENPRKRGTRAAAYFPQPPALRCSGCSFQMANGALHVVTSVINLETNNTIRRTAWCSPYPVKLATLQRPASRVPLRIQSCPVPAVARGHVTSEARRVLSISNSSHRKPASTRRLVNKLLTIEKEARCGFCVTLPCPHAAPRYRQ